MDKSSTVVPFFEVVSDINSFESTFEGGISVDVDASIGNVMADAVKVTLECSDIKTTSAFSGKIELRFNLPNNVIDLLRKKINQKPPIK